MTRPGAALHKRVLDQVTTGVLPRDSARGILAAYGDGSPCTVCGEATGAHGVTYTMRLGVGADTRTAYMHCACFELWEEIRRLPAAATACGSS